MYENSIIGYIVKDVYNDGSLQSMLLLNDKSGNEIIITISNDHRFIISNVKKN